MSRTYNNVIVFGPTGTIGGQVALEAQRRGAKVWLAMRDTSKPIDEIPADVEKTGNFARIQADLSDPASVSTAITHSGAKAAYLYLIYTPDFTRASLQAMRDAGVEYVVFLSSYNVGTEGDEMRAIPRENWIPYAHAQVEINIEDIGFPHFTALRPAWFASNYFKTYFNGSSTPARATIVFENSIFDNIAPEDIALVGGAVLAQRPADGKKTIYLYGPERRTAKESWEVIKSVTGREIDTTPSSPAQFTEVLSGNGIPAFLIDYLLGAFDKAKAGFSEAEYQRDVGNFKKYTGRELTKFADYIQAHKAEWLA
ncbi:NmrA domain-containing protein [Mycena indigotica]|uniref:NmrA domain-containing protein n=1 Tax=Mycena indigotica TaxID=2126181 RepID=A0A8H6T5R8_9AGAR|nr:NmrA domain-containing protein [Mycena indigotica]KAF7309910.1 NmrA domain-containing protein [Mycena indigotica]